MQDTALNICLCDISFVIISHVLSLSLTGCSGAQINQTQSLVLEKGHQAQLICKQTYGHNNMFWYRQDPGQGLQLLFLFVHEELTDKGNVTDRFQAKKLQPELLSLDISPVKPEDSLFLPAPQASPPVETWGPTHTPVGGAVYGPRIARDDPAWEHICHLLRYQTSSLCLQDTTLLP